MVVYDGRPEIPYEFEVIVVPADLPQPISFLDAEQYAYNNDRSGSFSVPGLAAGEYLVGVLTNPDYTPSLTEMIGFVDAHENPLIGYPATRVRVQDGQTTDVEVRIFVPVFPTVEPITTLPGLPRGGREHLRPDLSRIVRQLPEPAMAGRDSRGLGPAA